MNSKENVITRHWHVHVTAPGEKGNRYSLNRIVGVIADTAETAIVQVKTHHPNATIRAVRLDMTKGWMMKANEAKVPGRPLTDVECLRTALAGILQEIRPWRVLSTSEDCAVIEYKINISNAMMSYLESLAKGEQ